LFDERVAFIDETRKPDAQVAA